jgi:hypothetical protein
MVLMLDEFPYSRFQFTPTVQVPDPTIGQEGTVEAYDQWVPPEFFDTVTDDQISTYLVHKEVEGRPDLIAGIVYGTYMLDWVLIAFNKPTETLNWPRAGTVIKYPSQNVVLANLS